MTRIQNSRSKVVMLTIDRKLDRRIILEARSLCRMGYAVTVLAFPWADAAEEYDREPFILKRIGERGLSKGPGRGPSGLNLKLFQIYDKLNRRNAALSMAATRVKSLARAYLVNIERFYTRLFLPEAAAEAGDVYHVHDLHPLPAGYWASRLHNARLVYDSHELFVEQEFNDREKQIWRRIEDAYIRRADRVVTINDSIARTLAGRYGIPTPVVIQNCESRCQGDTCRTETEKARRRFTGTDISPDQKILLYQGGIVAHRNLEVMVGAMRWVKDHRVVLLILGNGPLVPILEKKIEHWGLCGRAKLVPGVAQQELLRITAAADVGIIPYGANCLNTRFCTPNKLYEFIAAGIPVLVNDLPELRAIVEREGNGWVANLDDSRGFARAIDTVFSDSTVLASRTARSRKAFDRLCWEVEEKKLELIYGSL